jgi:hypothetical protein
MNKDTNDARTVQTTDAGAFTFTNLNPGHYKLSIAGAGFSTVNDNDIVVAAGDRRRVDTQMSIGGSLQTIDVNTSTPALQTDSSSVASTVTEQAVQDLPLNGRNFVQ